jgi:polar amino acid transport system substrate-binding protein
VWFCLLLGALAVLPSCQGPRADALEEVHRRGQLRWGGDEEGGGPYIYRSDDGSHRLIGFEVELMDCLSGMLSVRSEFKQCQWDDLLKYLNNGNCDVVVNGYELTPERLQTAIATIPYYVYELVLFALKDDPRLTGWDDLKRAKPGGGKWKVGVLTSTAADNYLTQAFPDGVEVVRFNGTTDAFRALTNRTIDAKVTDTPPAVFYGPQFPVRQIGPPAQRGYYVMYLRPGDERLRDEINHYLRAAIADGRLQAILNHYKLWNATQEQLKDPVVQAKSENLRSKEGVESNWEVVRRNLPLLLKGAGMTVLLSVVSMPLAILVGLLVALGRLYGPTPLRWLLAGYVELIRGTPLLLQLYFIYYGLMPALALPEWVLDSAAFVAAVAGLAINYSAYEAEIYRAGLLAIPVGQTEAALALGLTRRQAIWHVVVPQAVRLVVPPVTNDFINLFKDTSICSVITVVELSKQYNMLVNSTPRAFVELAVVTAALYLIMSYPLSLLTRRLERRSVQARA